MKPRVAYLDTTREPAAPGRATTQPPGLMLTIVAHPVMRRIGERYRLDELAAGRGALLSRFDPEFRTVEGRLVGPIDEPHVSRTPLRIEPRAGDGVVLVPPPRSTPPIWIDGVPLGAPLVLTGEALKRGVLVDLSTRVLALLHYHAAVDETLPKFGLVGESAEIHRVRADIQRAAATTIPVLIRGESGTGKELVARAIHAASPRAARPYVAINVAALNPQTVAAELFGHSRGSFTGAVHEREGLFRDADGGTLFLDEIGEASVEVQATLLRVLETGEIQPIGGRPGRRVDVRLLTATDANLERSVLHGNFRLSLLHRLAGYELHLPPLRERRDDIPRLLVHFIEHELRRTGRLDRLAALAEDTVRSLPTRVLAALLNHNWPGNVRELGNRARRMVTLLLADQDGADAVADLGAPATPPVASPPTIARAAGDHSDDELMEALAEHGWQVSATARALGVSRKSLYVRIAQNANMHRARDLTSEALRDALAAADGDLGKAAGVLRVSVRALQLRLRELKMS